MVNLEKLYSLFMPYIFSALFTVNMFDTMISMLTT